MSPFAHTALTTPEAASDERALPAAKLLIVDDVAENRAVLSRRFVKQRIRDRRGRLRRGGAEARSGADIRRHASRRDDAGYEWNGGPASDSREILGLPSARHHGDPRQPGGGRHRSDENRRERLRDEACRFLDRAGAGEQPSRASSRGTGASQRQRNGQTGRARASGRQASDRRRHRGQSRGAFAPICEARIRDRRSRLRRGGAEARSGAAIRRRASRRDDAGHGRHGRSTPASQEILGVALARHHGDRQDPVGRHCRSPETRRQRLCDEARRPFHRAGAGEQSSGASSGRGCNSQGQRIAPERDDPPRATGRAGKEDRASCASRHADGSAQPIRL